MSWTLLANSLLVATLATAGAVIAGFCVAVSVLTSTRAWKMGLLTATVGALVLPPFLVANTWLEVTTGLRVGSAAGELKILALALTSGVLALVYWPITTLLVSGAWGRLQPEQFEIDSRLRGLAVFRWLLIPASKDALILASAVTLVLCMANFTIPVLFQVYVFTEEMWVRFNTQFDTWASLRAAWPLLLFPLLPVLFVKHLPVSWPRWSSASVGTISSQRLDQFRSFAQLAALGIIAISFVWPVGLLTGTNRTWMELPGALAAGWPTLLNSFFSAAGTATLAVLILLTVVLVRKRRVPLPRFAWMVFFLPGIFLGELWIYLFNRPSFNWLYGSLGIVLVAFVVRYGVIAWGVVAIATRGSDPDLVDAIHLQGANAWNVFRYALWPQIRSIVLGAWYAIYLLCLWDVETIILIMPPGGETVAVRIFNLLHYGHAGQVNALCLSILGLALLPFIAWRVLKRTLVAGRGAFSRIGRWGTHGLACACAVLVLPSCSREGAVHGGHALDSTLFSSVWVIGTRGVAPGQFNKPRSVICDRSGNVFVADMTGRIQKFAPDGKFLLQWQMPQTDLGKPKGLGIDSCGNILVVEPHYQRINHFSPEGSLVLQWGKKGLEEGEFILPRAVVQNSKGEFFVSEYTVVERVQRFGQMPTHDEVASFAGIPAPKRESDNSLEGRSTELPNWDGHSIPSFQKAWGKPGMEPGQFNRAEGLCLGPNDTLYVADSCNHRVQVFSRDGHFIRSIGHAGSKSGELSYPYDVRVDSKGHLFICEFGNSRISVLDASDHVVEVIGRPGNGAGEFANPWSIALDVHENLYVADSQNHRVQVFQRRPLLASYAANIKGDNAATVDRLRSP